MTEIPLLRAPPPKATVHRCYRCPAEFQHRDEFKEHDDACLQRAIDSDARNKAMRGDA